MNILYLKYAVEVAECGTMNKAADKLYVAQPNLSRAIKELERELGITIFIRNKQGMTLTPDGEKLIAYGRDILRRIDETEAVFRDGGAQAEKAGHQVRPGAHPRRRIRQPARIGRRDG